MFSIAICTYNKSREIYDTLTCISNIELQDTEIVIIDNNSTDDTLNVCNKFTKIFENKKIPFNVIKETSLGLSFARNTACNKAKGKYIIFLDDDSHPSECFLREYKKAVDLFPTCGIAGGTIIPRWGNGQAPAWLPAEFHWIYGQIRYLGNGEPRLLNKNETINGGNFLVRRDVFEKYGCFNTSLGNKGETQGGAEEQNFLDKIKAIGFYDIICVPKALVVHKFPLVRENIEYAKHRLKNASIDSACSDLYSKKYLIIVIKLFYYMFLFLAYSTPFQKIKYRAYFKGLVLNLIKQNRKS